MPGRTDVVRVESQDRRGTGFFIRGGGLVTALHIVADVDGGRVDWRGPLTFHFVVDGAPYLSRTSQPLEALALAHDVVEDWVVLQVEAPAGVHVWQVNESVQPGERWSTYGFPRVDGLGTGGVVRAIDAPQTALLDGELVAVAAIQLLSEEAAAGHGQPVPGFSGAPVVIDGRVVGLLRNAPHDEHGVAVGGILFACPAQRLMEGLGREPARPDTVGEQVFVAHARGDKLLVMRLCRDLLRRGVKTWLDVWECGPNDELIPATQRVLEQASSVLVCDGPSGSGLHSLEYGEALRAKLSERRCSALRVRLPGGRNPARGEGVVIVQIDEQRWQQDVGALAEEIGVCSDRSRWRGLEARSLGLAEDQLSPYRGLSPFRPADARWMFGRDHEIAGLLALAEEQPLVTVIGASGSGKSSLVLAGLCPLLLTGVGPERFELAYIRPGRRPCEELAHALSTPTSAYVTTKEIDSVLELHERLCQSSETLKILARRRASRGGAGPAGPKLLLVIDQLEEIFTEARLGQADESPEVMPFIQNIIAATEAGVSSLQIVMTLRADFLPHCLAVPKLAQTLNAGSYFALPPMNEAQLRDVIELPAQRVGFDVDPRLVEKLVAGSADQPGRLPLLQYVLRELWTLRDEARRTLSVEVYPNTGGLEGAIATAAERALARALAKIGPSSLTITRKVMTRLIHFGEGSAGDTRRRATITELGESEQTRIVLDVFVREARVLTCDQVDNRVVFEIAHEALLREWNTLVDWLNADRGALRLRQEVAHEAARFQIRQDPEYMWGRGRVEEARRILATSSVELNTAEEAFIATCERALEVARETAHRKRRKRMTWTASLVSLAFLILISMLWYSSKLAEENAQQAEQNAALATERQTLADKAQTLADNNAELATAALETQSEAEEAASSQRALRATSIIESAGSYMDAAVLTIEALEAAPTTPSFLAQAAMQELLGARPMFDRFVFEGHQAVVTDIAMSPDGEHLATADETGNIRVWRTDSGAHLTAFQHPEYIYAIAFTPDGDRIVSLGRDGMLRLDTLTTEKHPFLVKSPGLYPHDMAMSEKGDLLATDGDEEVYLWSITPRKIQLEATLETGSHVASIAISSATNRLAVGSSKGFVSLWDTRSGHRVGTLNGHTMEVGAAAYSPDGSVLATGDRAGVVRLWNPRAGASLATFTDHRSFIKRVEFSPDGSRLASAGDDHVTRVWDIKSNKLLFALHGHTKQVADVDFSPDGGTLATASWDASVRLWDMSSGRQFGKLSGHDEAVEYVFFSHDGRLATGSRDGTARISQISSQNTTPSDRSLGKIGGLFSAQKAMRFSPDGRLLAIATWNHNIELWDLTTEETVATLEGHVDWINDLVFSPDGELLATGSDDHSVRVWDVASGTPRVILRSSKTSDRVIEFPNEIELEADEYEAARQRWDLEWNKTRGDLVWMSSEPSPEVKGLAFSPDGAHLAIASEDGLRAWSVGTSELNSYYDSGKAEVIFSADGAHVAAVDFGYVHVWELRTRRAVAERSYVEDAIAFHPDSLRIALVEDDRLVRLWDFANDRLVPVFESEAEVEQLVFIDEGSVLIAVDEYGGMEFWDLEAHRRLGRYEEYYNDPVLAFGPGAKRYAVGYGEFVDLYPMPIDLLPLLCRDIRAAHRYGEVSATCDPVINGR